MTICPIALIVHCAGCPLVKVCPGKSLLGDFDTYVKKVEDSESDSASDSEPEAESK